VCRRAAGRHWHRPRERERWPYVAGVWARRGEVLAFSAATTAAAASGRGRRRGLSRHRHRGWVRGGHGGWSTAGRHRGPGRHRYLVLRPQDGAVGGNTAAAFDRDQAAAEAARCRAAGIASGSKETSEVSWPTSRRRSSSTPAMRRAIAARYRGSRQPSPAVSCRTFSMT
jgi:hypothetical protein